MDHRGGMTRAKHPTTRALSDDECLHLLESAAWGRLAIILGDRPQIFPVNHVLHEGAIVFRTGSGTKLDTASGRVVAFQVDGLAAVKGAAWSVQVTGRAHEVTDVKEITGLLALMPDPWEAGPKPHVVRIQIDELTGVTFPIGRE